MARSTREIVDDINTFNPLSGKWDVISTMLEELMHSPQPANGIESLLGVFERGPGIETGGGVFSDILHAIEHIPGYEAHLVKSLQRQPSIFSVRLVNRLLNSGVSEVAGTSLIKLLVDLANNPTTIRIVRNEIREVLTLQDPGALNLLPS
jgi:hypothetical protein